MLTTSDTSKKILPNDVTSNSSNFKNTSMSSISTVASKTTTTGLSDQNTETAKKRLESLTDEEIIERDLKELMDKKNREERKANGRLVAVIVASLVIFLGIYHIAWVNNEKKPSTWASVLVPVVIMLSFGCWVVVLAKRDKARRQMFEKYMEEMATKNKQELEAKAKTKTHKKSHDKKSSKGTVLHYENEITKDGSSGGSSSSNKTTTTILKNSDHRKHRKHRNTSSNDSGYNTTSSNSSKKSSAHYATKDLRIKRPSIRQKLFRQTGHHNHMPATQTLVEAIINTPVPQCTSTPITTTTTTTQQPLPAQVIGVVLPLPLSLVEAKCKRLQRLDALQAPAMVRMSSEP